jgi:quinol-cytochrome oxidoreductase complex cytochrome b subunit
MKKRPAPDGVVMTLSLPSLAGLMLLLLAVTDPSIRYSPNFHNTLITLVYLGFVTSLIALGLAAFRRTGSSSTTKICFVLNLAWLLYSSPMICAAWMFTQNR